MFADFIKILADGGPYAVAAASVVSGWSAWWWERRAHQKTTDKLVDLSTAQIEATMKNEAAINSNTRIMEQLIGRI